MMEKQTISELMLFLDSVWSFATQAFSANLLKNGWSYTESEENVAHMHVHTWWLVSTGRPVHLLLQMGWGYCQVWFSWQKFSLLPTISALQEKKERVMETDGGATCTVLTKCDGEKGVNVSFFHRLSVRVTKFCVHSSLADTSTQAHLILWDESVRKGESIQD